MTTILRTDNNRLQALASLRPNPTTGIHPNLCLQPDPNIVFPLSHPKYVTFSILTPYFLAYLFIFLFPQ